MSKVVLVLTFLLLGHSFIGTAQSSTPATLPPPYFLVLQTSQRRIKFYEGQKIGFKLVGERKRYSGTIKTINKRSLVFWDTEIAFRDIEKITLPTRSLSGKALSKFGSFLRGVGGLAALVGGANYFIIPEDPESGKVTFATGLSTHVLGRSLQGFRRRTYKINKNRTLKAYPL